MPYSPRPIPLDPLGNALRKLRDAIDGSPPHISAPQHLTLNAADQALVDAVRANDIEALNAAFKAGAQANAGAGKALQVAAENKNEALMQELVICGADVPTALAGLKAEQKSIFGAATLNRHDPHIRAALEAMIGALAPPGPRGRVQESDVHALMNELDRQLTEKRLLPGGAQKRATEMKAAIQTLEEWNARFTKEIAPVEILRQQRQILEQLAEMKRAMFPDRLDKPKFSGPKIKSPKP